MYYINKIGQIFNSEMELVRQGDQYPEWQLYVQYLQNGGTLHKTDFESETQKAEKELERKRQQHAELLETDWYVVRFAETGVPIPQEIIDLRNQIRNKYESI
jgi:hypothetical protein